MHNIGRGIYSILNSEFVQQRLLAASAYVRKYFPTSSPQSTQTSYMTHDIVKTNTTHRTLWPSIKQSEIPLRIWAAWGGWARTWQASVAQPDYSCVTTAAWLQPRAPPRDTAVLQAH